MDKITELNSQLTKLYQLPPRQFSIFVFALISTWSMLFFRGSDTIVALLETFSNVDISGYYWPDRVESIYDKWNQVQKALFTLFLLVILAPILETFIFQGIVHASLTHFKLNPMTVILISTVIFGSVHYSNGLGNMINAYGLGIGFALMYEYHRQKFGHGKAIGATILLHALWNFTVAGDYIRTGF